MTRKKAEKKAEKIAKGIIDIIECNTVDIDEWAEFWGFTREEYEEFLETAIKALEQKPKTGHWIKSSIGGAKVCSVCKAHMGLSNFKFCPNCGVKMIEPQERSDKE